MQDIPTTPEPLLESSASQGTYARSADAYAAKVDSHPHHTLYARPNTLALLPDVGGLDVLDIGCGPGWYAEQLLAAGAGTLFAIDYTARFVELTRQRLVAKFPPESFNVQQADLNDPLDFLVSQSFDVALAPLVLHYIQDWRPMLHEIGRVLRYRGQLVFSTHHPFMDWQEHGLDNYYATVLLEEEWRDMGKMHFYHRSLTDITESLHYAGFVIERLVEGRPLPEFQAQRPDDYAKLMTHPWFLFIRARWDG